MNGMTKKKTTQTNTQGMTNHRKKKEEIFWLTHELLNMINCNLISRKGRIVNFRLEFDLLKT